MFGRRDPMRRYMDKITALADDLGAHFGEMIHPRVGAPCYTLLVREHLGIAILCGATATETLSVAGLVQVTPT